MSAYEPAPVPGDDVAVVAVSADTTPAAIEAPVALADGTALTDRLGSGVVLAVEGGTIRLTVPPMSSAVFTAP